MKTEEQIPTPRTSHFAFRDSEVPADATRRIADWKQFAEHLERELHFATCHAICAYCGAVLPGKDSKAMRDHAVRCNEHPIHELAQAKQRLDIIERVLFHIPDVSIFYAEDGAQEDDIGMIPQGWNMRCPENCSPSIQINAPHFPTLLDAIIEWKAKEDAADTQPEAK